MIVDFHTHLLYGIDDGSKSEIMSRQMLNELQSLQIQKVVLTPHFYPYHQSKSRFLKKRSEAFEKLKEIPESKNFEFVQGAEVYLDSLLLGYESLLDVCIGSSDYILIEMPMEEKLSNRSFELLESVISQFGVTPILAHIDRYAYMQKEDNLMRLKNTGCLFQLNLASFSGFFSKKAYIKYIGKGYIDAFGTDFHKPPLDKTALNKAYSRIVRAVGDGALTKVKERSERIFSIALNQSDDELVNIIEDGIVL